MSAEVRPYTAIPNYLDRTPQDLCAQGNEMAYFPWLASVARGVTALAAKQIIIDDSEIERYQEAGTVLAAPTHRSFLDLPAMSLLGELSGEGHPFFMSKRENMDNKLTAWLYGHIKTFPIERDPTDSRWGQTFMKWGRYIMGDDFEKGEQDSKLVMFPEGTRKVGDIVEGLEPGTTVLATWLKKLILPIGIATSSMGISKGRPTVYVAVGEPFKARPKGLDLLAEKMQEQYDRAGYTLQELEGG